MPPALDERVETPTHRSRRTHQRTGAGEQNCPIPTAHFMALAARIAFVGKTAALVVFFTAFIAFIAAARIAFAMTRGEVSRTPLKRLKASKVRS